MISGGDEMGRTQKGNNNAYCQDNEISWYDWTPSEEKELLIDFTCRLIALRKDHPNLRRRKFFQDRAIHNSAARDIAWFSTDGKELDEDAWNAGWVRTLGMMLGGTTLNATDQLGNSISDNSFLLLLNAHHEPVNFALPPPPEDGVWQCILNTNHVETPFKKSTARRRLRLEGRTLILLMEREKNKPTIVE